MKPKGLVQTRRETYQACITKWLPMLNSARPEVIVTFIRSIHNLWIFIGLPILERNKSETDTTGGGDNADCAAFARSHLDYFVLRGPLPSSLSGPSKAMRAVMAEIPRILARDHIDSSTRNQLNFPHDLVIHPTRKNCWLCLASILPAVPLFSSSPSNPAPPLSFVLPKLILDHITDLKKNRTSRQLWTPSPYHHALLNPFKEYLNVMTMRPISALPDFQTQSLQWLLPFVQSVTNSNQFSIGTFDVLQKSLAEKLQQFLYNMAVRVGAANLTLAIWQDLTSHKAEPNGIISHPQDQPPPLLLHP
ncbi:hypothetical protein PCASD_22782 [Puccinia coronata f. sp. avenae]|uniref:Uncharacterized protein n=1 Tax=Puccinia coronata f. sp. avenae TaxID=200324 RepID=A0A2N5TJ49_9BASI|nr:hypothetical protein PCASD_22782 [Puccinia coronata f. sp. avenae]